MNMRIVLWYVVVLGLTGMTWLLVMRGLPDKNFPILLLIGEQFAAKSQLPSTGAGVAATTGSMAAEESSESAAAMPTPASNDFAPRENDAVPESDNAVPQSGLPEQKTPPVGESKVLPVVPEKVEVQSDKRSDWFKYYFLPQLRRNQKQYVIPYLLKSNPGPAPEIMYRLKENYKMEAHPGNVYLIQAQAGNKLLRLTKISFPEPGKMQVDMLNEYPLALSEVFEEFIVDKSAYRFSEVLAVDTKISGTIQRIDLPPMLELELTYPAETAAILRMLIEKRGALQLELPGVASMNMSNKQGKLLHNFEFDIQKTLKAYQRMKKNSALTVSDMQREIRVGWVIIDGRKLFKVEFLN
ncbi:MAG: hypothetical protein RRY34_08300, partial [Victivallaceae bacterium]